MASEPAEPTTRPQDDVIQKALVVTERHMGGYHATKQRQRAAVEAMAEAGLLADPAQTTELEELRAKVEQLLPLIEEREEWRRYMRLDAAEIRNVEAERDERQARIDRVSETCEAAAIGIALGMARNPARWECAEAAIEDVRAALVGDQPSELPSELSSDLERAPDAPTELGALSGVALRAVEAAADAAGDLP